MRRNSQKFWSKQLQDSFLLVFTPAAQGTWSVECLCTCGFCFSSGLFGFSTHRITKRFCLRNNYC